MGSFAALKPISLMGALMEAQKQGFEKIKKCPDQKPEGLAQFAEKLFATHVDYKDYVRFGCYIIRLKDAWAKEAEIYELS